MVQVVHGDVITYRQNVDKLAEQQQSKYLDLYTILPSEISMQLAEVSLALGAIEDQVTRFIPIFMFLCYVFDCIFIFNVLYFILDIYLIYYILF